MALKKAPKNCHPPPIGSCDVIYSYNDVLQPIINKSTSVYHPIPEINANFNKNDNFYDAVEKLFKNKRNTYSYQINKEIFVK